MSLKVTGRYLTSSNNTSEMLGRVELEMASGRRPRVAVFSVDERGCPSVARCVGPRVRVRVRVHSYICVVLSNRSWR